MHIILNVLANYERLFNTYYSDEGHRVEKKKTMFVWGTTNPFSKKSVLGKIYKKKKRKKKEKTSIWNYIFVKALFNFQI